MSARSGIVSVAIAAAAGALSGALAVTLAPNPSPTTEASREVYYVARPGPSGESSTGRGAETGSSRVADAGSASQETTIAVARPALPQTPEEREADRLDREGARAAAIDEHYREPDDPSWSRSAERTIGEHAQALAGAMEGVSVVSVDCRRDTCATLIEWDSFDRARLGFRPFVERTLGMNCEQRIVLPEPADRSAPYQGTMIMRHCAARE